MPDGADRRTMVMAHDARHCARIVRTHARTFALASHFLPPHKRRAAYALYAFCRVADDIVDECDAHRDDAAAATALAAYRRRLDDALDGRADDPIFRELAGVVHEHEVPRPVLHELLDGVARDLVPARYASWSALGHYCEGVASTVGEMCAYVFGLAAGPLRTAPVHARDAALCHARTLGVAMQLTNILRDVGEDARRGRCYLPEEELRAVGLDGDAVLAAAAEARPALARDRRWQELMRFQVARARSLYEAAEPGIGLLAPDARRCATACATGYAAILDAIEARGHDTLTARATVPTLARAGILWRVWRGGEPQTTAQAAVVPWEQLPRERLPALPTTAA